MRLAVHGTTNQIARSLISSFAAQKPRELALYARRPEAMVRWLNEANLATRHVAADFAAFTTNEHFDAILNFVGVGNPDQAAALSASMFDAMLKYEEIALSYSCQHPTCSYIFLSSGAAYG